MYCHLFMVHSIHVAYGIHVLFMCCMSYMYACVNLYKYCIYIFMHI